MKLNSLTPDSSMLSELGTRLARIRKQQGFSQERLAEQSGIGVATVRRIEDGKDSQLGSWLKMLKALQMTSSIEGLLPEVYASPMNEVREGTTQYRKTKGKHPSSAVTWGDEQE